LTAEKRNGLTGIRKGLINYNSDNGRIELKDIECDSCYNLDNVDIINSKIGGNIKQCDIFDSIILNSDMDECNIFDNTTVEGSKIKNSYVNKTSKLKNCYIYGHNGVCSGEIIGGIFREGNVTKLCKISKETEVIEQKIVK
jgi:hypothetical protein